MKKFKTLVSTILFLLLLNSCGTVAEGLGGKKKKNSDEFLVEKKAPLVLPPSFGELPEPGIKPDRNVASTEENNLSIEKRISQSSSSNSNIENNVSSSSIEKSIIKKINERKIKENSDENVEKKIEKPKKSNFFKKLKEKFN